MKLGRAFLKLTLVALGIFCAFMISACVKSRGGIVGAVQRAEARSCKSCNDSSSGLGYTLNDDGESYSLSFVGKSETKVVVPAEHDGKPVTKIAGWAFAYYYTGCSSGYKGLSLKELTLPATITEIETNAFLDENYDSYDRGSIGKLYFNGTVEQLLNISFGSSPFSGRTELYIGGELVEELTVPESVTEVGAKTFFGLGSLKQVNFHENVTKIGEKAFRNCDGLETLDIPDGVTELGNDAFYDCDGLQEVSLGTGVTSIPRRAFAGCPHLYKIDLKGVLTELGVSAFDGCKSLLEIDLSTSELTEIPSAAFYNCYNLTTFVVPESVTQIGTRAFYGCEKLLEIYNLSSLNLSCGSEYNGHVAYYALIIHTSLDEPSSITQVDDFVFYKGESNVLLKYSGEGGEITLPELSEGETYSVTNKAFAQNNRITSVSISDCVTSIGQLAFYKCDKLTSVNFGGGVKSIGKLAFSECSALLGVEVSSPLETVGESAFEDCTALETVVLPATVKTIGESAFEYCTKLESVNTGGAKEIGYGAFYLCKKLSALTLSEGLQVIGGRAFCSSGLTSVHIPSTVTEIGAGCFNSCALESITVAAGNAKYKSSGNCLIDIANATLIKACKTSSVPTDGSFTAIGVYAFAYTEITSAVVPEGVTDIGHGAFTYCKKLKSVEIKEGVTIIEEYAFRGCEALTQVSLPKSLQRIEFYAFCDCGNLKTVNYAGTHEEWDSFNKSSSWIDGTVWIQTSNGKFKV